jgi:hypothetical protein
MQEMLWAFSAMGAVLAGLMHVGARAAIPAVAGGAAGYIYDRLVHRDDRRR